MIPPSVVALRRRRCIRTRHAIGTLMRQLLPIALLGVLVSGSAGASSLLPRTELPGYPSIIFYGEPETAEARPSAASTPDAPPEDASPISPSVIALGEPAVEPGEVASIGDEEKARQRNPRLPPMVIRGGIPGDPFEQPGEEESAPQEATAPQPPQEPAPPVEPAFPEPVPPFPAPPTVQQE
jgi:hypothetical protein